VDESLEALVRIVRFVLLIILSVSFLERTPALQAPISGAQALKLLQQAYAALNPGTPTTDVTLSGSAHRIAGSDEETGTVVLKAVTGASRIDLSLPSGEQIEVRNGSTRNNVIVDHLTISQGFAALPSAQSAALQRLSQIDVYLDAGTLLPSTMTFTIHPDNDELLDIPAEISFTDYRLVNGVQIPFHVQKSLNNSLSLDIQFQNVSINSGLSAKDFLIQ
jgi:hypothetical protein